MFHGTIGNRQQSSQAARGAGGNAAFFAWTLAIVGVIVPLMLVAYSGAITSDSILRAHIIIAGFKAVVGLLVAIVAIGYAFMQPAAGRVGEGALQRV